MVSWLNIICNILQIRCPPLIFLKVCSTVTHKNGDMIKMGGVHCISLLHTSDSSWIMRSSYQEFICFQNGLLSLGREVCLFHSCFGAFELSVWSLLLRVEVTQNLAFGHLESWKSLFAKMLPPHWLKDNNGSKVWPPNHTSGPQYTEEKTRDWVRYDMVPIVYWEVTLKNSVDPVTESLNETNAHGWRNVAM